MSRKTDRGTVLPTVPADSHREASQSRRRPRRVLTLPSAVTNARKRTPGCAVLVALETRGEQPGVTVAGDGCGFTVSSADTARNGREAAQQARELHLEVILMGIRMPVWDGLQAARVTKAELPETKVIVLTTSAESEDLFEAVKSGATGYLVKSMDAEGLVDALHDAEQDAPPFAPGLAARLLAQFATASESAAPASA